MDRLEGDIYRGINNLRKEFEQERDIVKAMAERQNRLKAEIDEDILVELDVWERVLKAVNDKLNTI